MSRDELALERVESAVINFLSRRDAHRARWIRLTHVSDERGCCRACICQMNPIAWPCLVRQLADETIRRAIPTPRKASQ